ncbi:uncharacterized protein PRCAT00000725001 [Priceomyces carsonii]|uniref:uncharacterized protein n=1 Tax=Priceomyces carsonii TaxID=28549 RepID=UPI002ED79584|nr:unnamed protein product [Priceomyces carsonii]
MLRSQFSRFGKGVLRENSSVSTAIGLKFYVPSLSATGFLNCNSKEIDQKRALSTKKKTLSGERKQLNTLKTKLSKEKGVLSKLQKKYKEEAKKLKSKEKERSQKEKAKLLAIKAKDKSKKELSAATKTFRKLSPYNLFIKENTSTKSLKEATNAWNVLSDNEKDYYKELADDYNEQKLQIYTPKPKAPASGYAAFVKENYENDGRSFADINKELASEWKSLSNEEKAKYTVPESEKKAYADKLKAWTDKRLQLYRESKQKAAA